MKRIYKAGAAVFFSLGMFLSVMILELLPVFASNNLKIRAGSACQLAITAGAERIKSDGTSETAIACYVVQNGKKQNKKAEVEFRSTRGNLSEIRVLMKNGRADTVLRSEYAHKILQAEVTAVIVESEEKDLLGLSESIVIVMDPDAEEGKKDIPAEEPEITIPEEDESDIHQTKPDELKPDETEPEGDGSEETDNSEIDLSEEPENSMPEKGTILKSGHHIYEIADDGISVIFIKTESNDSMIVIPPAIEADGITYKVTGIAPAALKNNKKIKKVVIGKYIVSIGKDAFKGCTNLTEILIESEKLKTIGKDAFKGIRSSAEIAVPSAKTDAYKKLVKGKGQGSGVSVERYKTSADSLVINTDKRIADRHGIFSDSAVIVNADTGCYTVKVKNAGWLKVAASRISDISSGLSKLPSHIGSKFYLLAAENTGGKRTATVSVTHSSGKLSKNIIVTQVGNETSYLETDSRSITFQGPQAASSRAVHILADSDTKWTVSASVKWIKAADSASVSAKKYASREGRGTGTFYICVKANGTYKARSGQVTISAPGLGSHKITVTQAANTRSKKVLLEELKVSVSKKTFDRGKTSKIKFSFPKGLTKDDIKKVSYSSSKKKVTVVRADGTIQALRKGKSVITVKVTLKTGESKVFKLKVTVGRRTVKLSSQKKNKT